MARQVKSLKQERGFLLGQKPHREHRSKKGRRDSMKRGMNVQAIREYKVNKKYGGTNR